VKFRGEFNLENCLKSKGFFEKNPFFLGFLYPVRFRMPFFKFNFFSTKNRFFPFFQKATFSTQDFPLPKKVSPRNRLLRIPIHRFGK